MLSIAEENYIKAIYVFQEEMGMKSVNTNAIAERVQTSAASVTDMLKKLAIKKLIYHQKYKGVSLSKKGMTEALKLIRKHRIWETFLFEHLNFNWEEIHDLAEELEHINSIELTDRLHDYLNKPKHDPHGDPIPDINGKLPVVKPMSVLKLNVDEVGKVIALENDSLEFQNHLKQLNIHIGSVIKINDILSFDNSRVISSPEGVKNTLSKDVCEQLIVAKV